MKLLLDANLSPQVTARLRSHWGDADVGQRDGRRTNKHPGTIVGAPSMPTEHGRAPRRSRAPAVWGPVWLVGPVTVFVVVFDVLVRVLVVVGVGLGSRVFCRTSRCRGRRATHPAPGGPARPPRPRPPPRPMS